MIIIKTFYTRIDLINPSEIYNIENILLDKLNTKFLNKCYSGNILILQINKIIKKSNFIFHRNNIDGSGYIDVELEVTGLYYEKDEIIPDCKIENITSDGTIILSNKYIKSIFKKSDTRYEPLYKLLKKDMILPIIVENSSYTVNSNNISVISTPLIPKYEKLTIYNSTLDITNEQIDNIKLLYNVIEEEEKIHKEIYTKHKKAYDLFKNILYNYKNDQKFHETKLVKDLKLKPVEFSIDSLSKITSGIIMYPDLDNRANRRLFYSTESLDDEKIKDNEINIVNNSSFSIIMAILYKYYKYLLSLKGLVENYNSVESIEHLTNYFSVFNKLKK